MLPCSDPRTYAVSGNAACLIVNLDFRIASSQPIRFLVGPERQCYTIHGAIVGSLSRPLHAMVHGPSKEAEDSTIIWEDVKTETFLALWQYAYTDCLEEPKLLPALIELSPSQNMEPYYHEVVDENYTFGAYDRCWCVAFWLWDDYGNHNAY
jgi:hypothetical protein